MENLATLPAGWVWTTISEIAETTSGGTPLRSHPEYYGGDIPWVKSGELRDAIIQNVEEAISELGLENSSAKYFQKDTVVVALYGATVGKTGILGLNSTSNQAVCGIFPRNNSFISKYMFYWLQSQRQNLIKQSMGGAQPNISQGIIRSLAFPLPPLSDQERIVARIESLFTQLDAGVAALKRLQSALKRYRASVLKTACEGRLVPQDQSDEPVEELLKRMLTEKGEKAAKYPIKSSKLPKLPKGWAYATVDQLASSNPGSIQSGSFGSDLHHSEFQDTGILAIGIDNVLSGSFSKGKQHRISPEKYNQLRKFTARQLDVLITVMATVGRCCVVPANLETAIITKHVYRISTNQAIVNPYYLMYCFLGGEVVQKQISRNIRGQTRPGLNGVILRSIAIPLPPLIVQHCIVVEVERQLSVVQDLEQAISNNLKRAARLRQAILQRAFEGKLL